MPLYVLTAETAVDITENSRIIQGIFPPNSNTEIKLFKFADDTTLYLCRMILPLQKTFAFLTQCHERASGSKIYKGKCKGVWLTPSTTRSSVG